MKRIYLLFQHQSETGSDILLAIYADKKLANRKCSYMNRHQTTNTFYHVENEEVFTLYNKGNKDEVQFM